MSEPTRPTAHHCELIDIDVSRPFNGQNVLALGMGGKLAETVWTSESDKFFVAWMPYPKTPEPVKRKLYERYFRNVIKEDLE